MVDGADNGCQLAVIHYTMSKKGIWNSKVEFVQKSFWQYGSPLAFEGKKSLYFYFVGTGIYCIYKAGPCGTA